jgi:hypothetical protein
VPFFESLLGKVRKSEKKKLNGRGVYAALI